MDVYDHQLLVTGNKEFRERISFREAEMKILKDVRVNMDLDADFLYEDEVDTSARDVRINNVFNVIWMLRKAIQSLDQIWLRY